MKNTGLFKSELEKVKTMNVHKIQNPNGFAATFDLGLDLIDPYGKIVVPKGDAIAQYVPIAHSLLSAHDSFQRVDLIHTDDGTALTLNLGGFLAATQPEFQWDDQKRNTVQKLIDQFFVAANAQGVKPVNIDALKANYTAMEQFEIEDDADAQNLLATVNGVLMPMAAKHGGGFEIMDLEIYEESDFKDREFLSKDREHVNVIVSVFGACAACGSFPFTYGLAPKVITEALDKIDSPFQVGRVSRSDVAKGGMVFKR